MTNEEAREVLQEQIDKYAQEYDAEGIEALELAIKVLEQQAHYKEDLINARDNGYTCGYTDAMIDIAESEANTDE